MADEFTKEYEAGLRTQKDKTHDNDALENIKIFYQNNEKVCLKAYDYYKSFEDSIEKHVHEPIIISKGELQQLLHPIRILVLTVTSVEKNVFLHWLYDRQCGNLTTYLVDNLILTIYQLDNNRTIIHVNTIKTGEDETRIVLNQMRKIFMPTYVFMLGICYGMNMTKHSIGSVFISDRVSTFRLNFRDMIDSDETRFEAEDEYDKSPNADLIRKIKQFMSYTVIHSVVSEECDPTTAKSEIGTFLSSNSLVSSHKVKRSVMDQYANRSPKPLGGEMEAAGIFKSYIVEEDGFSDWIIIKSICDWGEKKNSLDADPSKNEIMKSSIQALAMTNTCGAFERIMKLL